MIKKNEQSIVDMIAEIKRLSTRISANESAYNDRIESIRVEYAILTEDDRNALEKAKKKLVTFLKKNKKDVFPGKTDRVVVAGGVLLKHVKDVVRKARHITVAFLRDRGLEGGIRIEESVDWKKIDTWPDYQLESINTERKKKESFAFELAGDK